MTRIAITIYRLMEITDGERGFKIIPYPIAQRIKMFCLLHIKDV